MAATLEIQVQADIKQAATGLQTLLTQMTKLGNGSELQANIVQTAINKLMQSAKGLENLDFGDAFQQASKKVNDSIEAMTAKALGMENLFEKFGDGVNLSALVASFQNTDKTVVQLEEQIFALRDAIKESTDPAIIDRFSQRLNQLTGELGQVRIKSAVKVEKIDAPQLNVPLIAPKIDLSQIKVLKAQFDGTAPSIEKITAELLQVQDALDKATDPTMVNLLRANFDQLKASLASVQSNALETAFIDAVKPAQLLENEIAALKEGIRSSLNPDDVQRFADRLQVLQTQLANTQLGGLDLSKISAPLSLLQSAFIDAVKPVKQLENELQALEIAKEEATDPNSVKIFSEQIAKLKQQLSNTRTAGLEGAFNKIALSSVKASGKLQQLPKATDSASFALLNLGRVAQDAPFGILGIANNLNPLLESLQRASRDAKEAGTSLGKTLVGSLIGGGGLGFALSIVSSLAIVFGDKLFGSTQKAESGVKSLRNFNEALISITQTKTQSFFEKLNNDIAEVAGQNAGRSVADIEKLSLALNNVSLSTTSRKNALEEYNKTAAESNKLQESDLNNLGKVNAAIDRQIELLKTRALIAGAQDKLAESFKTIFAGQFKLQQVLNKVNPTLKDNAELFQNAGKASQDLATGLTFEQSITQAKKFGSEGDRAIHKVSESSRDAATSIKDLLKFMDDLILKADDFGGAFDGDKNNKKDKKAKSQFLFQFLPFDPNGKLSEEQRADLLKAIRGFSKDFGDLLQGADFDVRSAGGGDEAVINLAKDFDKKLRAGLVKFKLPAYTVDVDLVPKNIGDPEQQAKSLFESFRRSFDSAPKEQVNGLFDVPDRTDILEKYALAFKRIGQELPKVIDIEDVFGNLKSVDLETAFGDPNKFNFDGFSKALQAAFEKVKSNAAQQLQELNGIFSNFFASSFAGIGETIGTAIASGNNAIQVAADSILGTLAELISQIGKALIQYGIVKTGLDKVLAAGIALPGPLAIGLGVAAVAAGALIRNSFKNIKGFAEGGLAFGPTLGLIGEGIGTSRSNPEVIAPLNKLKQFIGGNAIQPRAVVVTGRISGRDILISNARQQGFNSRNL